MKRIAIFLAAALFFAHQLAAISVITGTWNRPMQGDNVSLFKVENGKLKSVATSTFNEKKEFAFAYNVAEPAFFVVGVSPKSPMNNYSFFLKPGDNLNMAVNDSSYTLIGENSPENIELTRWHDLVEPLESKSLYFMKHNSTYVDFFPLFEEKLEEIAAFQSTVADASFNRLFEEFRKFDLLKIAIYFVQTPRSAHPKGEDFPDFYNRIKIEEITETNDILNYPYGANLLQMTRFHLTSRAAENMTAEERTEFYKPLSSLDRDLPKIINQQLRGEVVLMQAEGLLTFEGLKDFQEKYGQHLATENQKQQFQKFLMEKATNEEGQTAFDFRFNDVNGKEFALSDFKGKLVYVDVWATWCGPCKKELPSFKEIAKEYADQEIVFLGVSVDEQKSYDTWKEQLVSEDLPGVQLFAGDRADEIMKPYKISGIPRFMLFGKDGNIISANAPRPTSSEIRPLLDARLK